MELFDPYGQGAAAAAQMHIVPLMSSLEALLSKLPSVGPTTPGAGGMAAVAKEEVDAGQYHGAMDVVAAGRCIGDGGESPGVAATTATPASIYYVNVAKPSEGFAEVLVGD